MLKAVQQSGPTASIHLLSVGKITSRSRARTAGHAGHSADTADGIDSTSAPSGTTLAATVTPGSLPQSFRLSSQWTSGRQRSGELLV